MINIIKVIKADATRYASIYKEEFEDPYLIEMKNHLKLHKENPILNKKEDMQMLLRVKIKFILDNFKDDFSKFHPPKDLIKIAFGLKYISKYPESIKGNMK